MDSRPFIYALFSYILIIKLTANTFPGKKNFDKIYNEGEKHILLYQIYKKIFP